MGVRQLRARRETPGARSLFRKLTLNRPSSSLEWVIQGQHCADTLILRGLKSTGEFHHTDASGRSSGELISIPKKGHFGSNASFISSQNEI